MEAAVAVGGFGLYLLGYANPPGFARMFSKIGGSPGAEMIRKLLVEGPAERWDGTTEALLHFAARRDHLGCAHMLGHLHREPSGGAGGAVENRAGEPAGLRGRGLDQP